VASLTQSYFSDIETTSPTWRDGRNADSLGCVSD